MVNYVLNFHIKVFKTNGNINTKKLTSCPQSTPQNIIQINPPFPTTPSSSVWSNPSLPASPPKPKMKKKSKMN